MGTTFLYTVAPMGSGKHRHSKDKLYIVASEFARDWGGYKGNSEKVAKRVLPFDHWYLWINLAF